MPETLEFGIADETAWRSGLPCGGIIKVFVERLERERDAAFLDHILEAKRTRHPLAIVTNIATGTRQVLQEASDLPREIARCLASGESRLIQRPEGEHFVQALKPAIRLIIAGATHVGQVLAELAQKIGYDVIIVDPRTVFASGGALWATPIS